jgi:hypothetical protein
MSRAAFQFPTGRQVLFLAQKQIEITVITNSPKSIFLWHQKEQKSCKKVHGLHRIDNN